MILIAILIPGLSFIMNGKIISGIIALILQVVAVLTFVFFGIGFFIWLILAIWAIVSNSNHKSEKRTIRIIQELKKQ